MQHRSVLRSFVFILLVLISGGFQRPSQQLYAASLMQEKTTEEISASGPWTNFGDPLRDPILTMIPGKNDSLWIGSKSGLSIRAADGKWLTLTTNDGLAGSTVFAIFHDPKNAQLHWIGTNRGASLLDDGGDPFDTSKHRWITFSKEDGMANSRVSSIAMTVEGKLWFGLSYVDLLYCDERGDGIAVLDTHDTPFDKSDDSWSSFTASNSNLANNVIRRMTTDAKGIIWISMQGSLTAYQNGQWISYSTDQGLPSNDITALAIDDNHVWIGMRQGFGMLDYGKSLADRSDDQWQTFRYEDNAITDVSTLAVDSAGRVWIGRNDFYSLCFSGSDFGSTYLFDPRGTPFDLTDDKWGVIYDTEASAVRAIVAKGENPIFAQRAEIHQLNYGNAPFKSDGYHWQTLLASDGHMGTTVSTAANNFAFSSSTLFFVQDGELYQMDNQSTDHDRSDDKYLDIANVGSATSLLVDKNGYVWAGGSGVDIIDPNEYWYDPFLASYSKGFGLVSSRVNAMVMDDKGWVWIATGDTFEGGLHVIDAGAKLNDVRDDRWATFTAQQNGVLGQEITAVVLEKEKIAWIASNKGLARLNYGISPFDKNDDTWEQFTTANSGLANNFIRDLAIDSAGNLWIALAAGGVSVYTHAGEWITFTESDGLAYNAVNTVGVDSKNRIWLGTDGEGVSVLNNANTIQNKTDDQWMTYGAGETLLSGYIRNIYIDPYDRVWVGTFGGGLSLYADGDLHRAYLPIISTSGSSTAAEAIPATTPEP